THLTAAKRTGAMGRKDHCVVRQRQQLVMNAAVHNRGELLWRGSRGQIRPAHTAHEQRVSGEDRSRRIRVAAIVHQYANAFEGVPGSLQKTEATVAELNLVSVPNGNMSELGARSGAEIDLRSRAFRKFAMTRHEVGMDVSFDNIFDLPVPA